MEKLQPIQIRRAVVADVQGIAKVQVETWRSTYGGIVPQAFLDAMSVEKRGRVWQQLLDGTASDRHSVLVAVAADQVVGFVSFGRERAGDPEYVGEVGGIYILQPYQRQGTGRTLMIHATRQLLDQNFTSMLIWALRDNPSCRFYKRLGGHIVRQETMEIGGANLVEVAYGWNDLATALKHWELKKD